MAPATKESAQLVQPTQRPRAASPASRKDDVDAVSSEPVVKSNGPTTKTSSPTEAKKANFVKHAWDTHRRAVACLSILMLTAIACLAGAKFDVDELMEATSLIGAKESLWVAVAFTVVASAIMCKKFLPRGFLQRSVKTN